MIDEFGHFDRQRALINNDFSILFLSLIWSIESMNIDNGNSRIDQISLLRKKFKFFLFKLFLTQIIEAEGIN